MTTIGAAGGGTIGEDVVHRLRDAYAGESMATRLHVRGRWRSCPFGEVVDRVPRRGRILDVGCGHGLLPILLALTSPDRAVTGVDVDAAKLDVARRAAERAGVDVTFAAAPPADPEPWDAVTVVDVLYLLGREAAAALLSSLGQSLGDGGVLLVKELDVRPAWKYQLARLQELVATRVARITEGRFVEFVAPDDIAGTLVAGGLAVEHVALDRGRLHPHHLVVGRRSGAG